MAGKKPLLSSFGLQVEGFLLMGRTVILKKEINSEGFQTVERSEIFLCKLKHQQLSCALSGDFTSSEGEQIFLLVYILL